MNKEIKRKWVEALRSGEYTQGTGSLNKNNRFCCLGVLCDLYSKEKNEKWVSVDDEYKSLNRAIALPGQDVYHWAGMIDMNDLSTEDQKMIYEGQRTPLYRLNDSYHLSFKQIADLIEAQL